LPGTAENGIANFLLLYYDETILKKKKTEMIIYV